MQEYAGLARRIAQKYLPYCGAAVDMDDLMQAAAIGAMLAEASYSPEKSSWASWCAYYIRNEMRAAIGLRTSKRDPAWAALSLDAPMDEDGLTLGDSLEDDEQIIVEIAERQEVKQVIREGVAALPRDRRRVVELLDFAGKTKTKAAQIMGCSMYRLQTLQNAAYRDLRYNPRICALAISNGCRAPDVYRWRPGRVPDTHALGLPPGNTLC